MEKKKDLSEDTWELLDSYRKSMKETNERYDNKLKNLREKLISGKFIPTDKIKAFTTVQLGQWDDKTTQPFRDLQQKVQENQGKEVLVVKSTTKEDDLMIMYASGHQDSRGVMAPPRFYTTDYVLKLGKISLPLELNIQPEEVSLIETSTGEIIIPTLKTLSVNLSYLDFGGKPIFSKGLEWSVSEESIKERLWNLPHLLLERNRYDPSKKSQILFDKEIKEYFSKCHGGKEFYEKVQETLEKYNKNMTAGL